MLKSPHEENVHLLISNNIPLIGSAFHCNYNSFHAVRFEKDNFSGQLDTRAEPAPISKYMELHLIIHNNIMVANIVFIRCTNRSTVALTK